MSLSIQERLKDLRVERGLTLGQLAEQTGLSKSALGSYETEDFKDISHYALIRLAKFYGVTADYLLGLSEMKNHPNADLADLRLSDEMIDLLKSGRIDNTRAEQRGPCFALIPHTPLSYPVKTVVFSFLDIVQALVWTKSQQSHRQGLHPQYLTI